MNQGLLFDDEMLNPSNVELNQLRMQVVDNLFAKAFMAKYHYSKTCPSLYYSLGFYYNEYLLCMVCFGPPVGRNLAKSLLEGGNSKNVYELVRLFAFDWGPKNTESYCISKALKWLQENAPEVRLVVSYADPGQGHVGTIYQATNWLYTGQGARLVESYEYYVDGKWIHPRTMYSKYGTLNPKVISEMLGHEVKRRVIPHKHRYIYILGDRRKKRETQKMLKVDTLSYYPKLDEADNS